MNKKKTLLLIFAVTVAALVYKYSNSLFDLLALMMNILTPLILGCVIAYILNILVSQIEKLSFFRNSNGKLSRLKRPFSIVVSLVLILAILALIILIVIPQLVEALAVLAKSIPAAITQILNWLASSGTDWPQLEDFLSSLHPNWPQLIQKGVTYLTTGLSSLLTSTVFILSSIGNLIVTFVVAFIFALYILGGKEQLYRQFRTVTKTYIKDSYYQKLILVLSTAHDTFTKFIIGQCTEAVIIGVLCTIGMIILRFPYASMIGTLIGSTALIPVVGAYLGAFIGAFMIFTVNPIQAVGFLVFIVILQQLEGNLIYPKVVGSSVGLPGIWVLAAVTIGGGLGGIVGMLIAVPLTATAYRLLRQDLKKRRASI